MKLGTPKVHGKVNQILFLFSEDHDARANNEETLYDM